MYYNKPQYSIYRRKSDNRWCCELILGINETTGKHINRYLYAKTKQGAKVRYDEFLEEWEENKPIEAQNNIIDQISKWLYNIKIKKVSEKTFDRYEQTFQYQIVPGIMNTGINDINKFDVYAAQKVLDFNVEKGLSYSSVNKIKQLLNQFFNFALMNNYVKSNPIVLTEIKKNTEINLEDENADDIYVFTQEEIEKIKNACKTKYKNGKDRFHQAEFFIFMLNTGVRAGEALATRYSDIDFETGVYKINKTAVNVKERDKNGKSTNSRKRIVKTPKTKNSIRRMKLNPEILEIVKKLKSEEPEGYDGFIVHGPNGELFGERSLEKRFYAILKEAGLKQRGVHTLRHTFASMIYKKSGGQIELVSKLLGHCDPAFTAKIYVKIFDEYQDAVMNGFYI